VQDQKQCNGFGSIWWACKRCRVCRDAVTQRFVLLPLTTPGRPRLGGAWCRDFLRSCHRQSCTPVMQGHQHIALPKGETRMAATLLMRLQSPDIRVLQASASCLHADTAEGMVMSTKAVTTEAAPSGCERPALALMFDVLDSG
jgi:hypothetical protein